MHSDPRYRAALRETGHVAIASSCFIKVGAATIEPSARAEGTTAPSWDGSLRSRLQADNLTMDDAVSLAMIALAGDSAVRHAGLTDDGSGFGLDRGDDDVYGVVEGSDADLVFTVASKVVASTEEIDLFLAWVAHRTASCVAIEWARIEAIAVALTGQTTIGADDIRRLVRSYDPIWPEVTNDQPVADIEDQG